MRRKKKIKCKYFYLLDQNRKSVRLIIIQVENNIQG